MYSDEKGKESRLFERDKEENLHYVNKVKFKEGSGVKVPDNHLFLWRCDQNGGDISQKVLQWFRQFILIDSLHKFDYSLSQMKNDAVKEKILSFIKIADLGIEHMGFHEDKLYTVHKAFNADNNLVDDVIFYLEGHESEGTQKFFELSAPVLGTLEFGNVLILDELEASLHPMLTEYLISLFNNKEENKKNAQLIFTTHDTHLLAEKLFDRDQIWFTEKDQYGSTHLYSLLEFRKNNSGIDVRENDNLEKRYLQGRFGGVPNIGAF